MATEGGDGTPADYYEGGRRPALSFAPSTFWNAPRWKTLNFDRLDAHVLVLLLIVFIHGEWAAHLAKVALLICVPWMAAQAACVHAFIFAWTAFVPAHTAFAGVEDRAV